ncbi:MAG: hypothetical protein J6R99_00805 [Alphaproteobacteria bacterium]|nr:hypothetical protein [Alphaproteobacteria bacterium]
MIKFDKTVMYKGRVCYAGEAFEYDEADEKLLVKMGGRVVGEEKQPVRPVAEKKTKTK